MTVKIQTRSVELRKFGISLGYLATVAGRSVGYVKQWSSGAESSKHLDKVAADLVAKRQSEISGEAGK